MKTCTKCKCEMSFSSFNKDKTQKSGYRPDCKSCRAITSQKYHKNNKNNISQKKQAHYQANKIKIQARHTKRHLERLKTDVEYKISCNLRKRISMALKRSQRSGSAVRDLGCTIQEFKNMHNVDWNQYGKTFEIDHIIPLSHFDLTNKEQFLKACHYTNLRPLSIHQNRSEGNRR